MKKLIIIFMIFLGCSIYKETPIKLLDGATYVCDLGPMVGKLSVIFQDSIFIYNERGIFKSTGKWDISKDRKHVILKGRSVDLQNASHPMMINVDIQLKIKSRKQLIDARNGFTYVLAD